MPTDYRQNGYSQQRRTWVEGRGFRRECTFLEGSPEVGEGIDRLTLATNSARRVWTRMKVPLAEVEDDDHQTADLQGRHKNFCTIFGVSNLKTNILFDPIILIKF